MGQREVFKAGQHTSASELSAILRLLRESRLYNGTVLDCYASMSSLASHTCCRPDCLCNRVLIVDDEPGILFAYRKLLEQKGLVVDSCDCLCEALDYLEKHHYLAVVADMRLQGTDTVDGLDLVREVRRRQPAAGIIVASGTSDQKTRQSASELGVDHYLEKPIHPSRILDLLIQLRNTVHGEELLPAPETG